MRTVFSRPTKEAAGELAAIEKAVKNGTVELLDGVQYAISLGYLAIGAAKSRMIYNPYDFKQLRSYIDPFWGEHMMTTEVREDKKVVRGFLVAKTALLCGLFGNMDQPDRPELAEYLTDVSVPHYGWEYDSKAPYLTKYNVVQELQSAMRLLGDSHTGVIDMVWDDGSFFTTYEAYQLATVRPQARQATFTITGADFPLDIGTEPFMQPQQTAIAPRDYGF